MIASMSPASSPHLNAARAARVARSDVVWPAAKCRRSIPERERIHSSEVSMVFFEFGVRNDPVRQIVPDAPATARSSLGWIAPRPVWPPDRRCPQPRHPAPPACGCNPGRKRSWNLAPASWAASRIAAETPVSSAEPWDFTTVPFSLRNTRRSPGAGRSAFAGDAAHRWRSARRSGHEVPVSACRRSSAAGPCLDRLQHCR